MGRIFVIELEGRTYKCKFCKIQLALADDLVSQGEHYARSFRGTADAIWDAHCSRYILLLLWTDVGWKYEAAHEKSQKYKEGKFVLERGRIVDGLDTEFYIDARPVSDAEDA